MFLHALPVTKRPELPMPPDNAESDFDQIMAELKAGDQDTSQKVYQRFISTVIRAAACRLDPRLRGKVDPESVAQSTMMSFFGGIQEGDLEFQDWAAVYCFLATVAKRKALNRNRYHHQAKRGGGHKQAGSDSFLDNLQQDTDARPEDMAEINDTIKTALESLHLETRQTVELFLSNASKHETALSMNVSIRTVERRIEEFKAVYERLG